MKKLFVVLLSLASFTASATTPSSFEDSKKEMLKVINDKISTKSTPNLLEAKACLEAAKAQTDIQRCTTIIDTDHPKK